MFSMNKVFLIGRLGRDPELRYTQVGDAIVNFNLATGKSWIDKESGERKQSTEWHRVVIFNKGLAKIAGERLKKGSLVGVEGELKTREWDDDKKVRHYTTEVVVSRFNGQLIFLEKKVSDTDFVAAKDQEFEDGGNKTGQMSDQERDVEDIFDDIPF